MADDFSGLLTEEEARKKWCPKARVAHSSTDADDYTIAMAAVNRGGGYDAIEENSQCYASYCMAWRWAIDREPLTAEQRRGAGTAIGLAAALQPAREPRRGYCGAFGKVA